MLPPTPVAISHMVALPCASIVSDGGRVVGARPSKDLGGKRRGDGFGGSGEPRAS